MTALDTATLLAERICSAAQWRDSSCGWLDENGRSLGADLYGGNAGVAWFLGQHAALTGSGRSARTAAGAAQAVLDLVAGRAAPRSGLFQGDLGALWAAGTVGTLVGERALVERARELMPGIGQHLGDGAAGVDLISGCAGDLLAVLGLAGPAGGLPDRIARTLTGRADRMPVGIAWPGHTETEHTEPERAVHHVGMAHGPSGVACALLELDRATGTTSRYRTIACDAFAFERAWFDPAACGWQDPRTRRTSTSWCHGSAGIGLARLRAIESVPDPHVKAEAAAALASVHASVAAALSSRGPGADWEPANFSVCHGLMGSVDLLVEAAATLGVDEHLRAAERIVDYGASVADSAGRWPCGTIDGGETVGLFLGLAGIGAACLRVARPGRMPPVGLPVAPYSTSK